MASRKKVWQQFSNEIQATYVKGKAFKSDRIEALFKKWQIVYDIFAVPAGSVILVYTRVRAPYIAKSDFKFRITKKNFFNKISAKFRKANVETGDSRLDDIFVIKSNCAEKVKKLLSNEKISSLLLKYPKSGVEFSHGYKSIGRVFPKNCDGLSFVMLYESTGEERLMTIYKLFGEILTSLHDAGEIEAAPVDTELK